ncbi:MAG: CHASE2 domain-containing protein [Gloeotrichia echinulata IR180]|jgi:CHASE2 domain-containing sensor protein
MNQEVQAEHIQRDDLLDRLSRCPPGIFYKVTSYLQPPSGTLSSEMSSQAIRAHELLAWAENADGCGIEQLYKAYLRAIGKKKDPDVNQVNRNLKWSDTRLLLFITTVIFSLVTVVRCQGWLQKYELKAYDDLLQKQLIFPDKQDKRLLIISVTKDDVKRLKQKDEDHKNNDKYQKQAGEKGETITDYTLNELLKKINANKENKPRVIGLAMNREGKVSEKYAEINSSLKNGNLVVACTTPASNSTQLPKALDDAPVKRIGFEEIFEDQDEVVRRVNFWKKRDTYKAYCKDSNIRSLPWILAFSFLKKDGYTEPEKADDYEDFINIYKNGKISAKIPLWKLRYGGYYDPDSQAGKSFQIMLNYRTYTNNDNQSNFAETRSLYDILFDKDFNSELLKDKIVIITLEDGGKLFSTPFSKKSEDTPAYFIYAQIASFLLDGVTGERPFISPFLDGFGDFGLILLCSFVGGAMGLTIYLYNWKQVIKLCIICLLFLVFLYCMCFISLWIYGIWLPLVPLQIALTIPIIIALIIRFILLVNYIKFRLNQNNL